MKLIGGILAFTGCIGYLLTLYLQHQIQPDCFQGVQWCTVLIETKTLTMVYGLHHLVMVALGILVIIATDVYHLRKGKN